MKCIREKSKAGTVTRVTNDEAFDAVKSGTHAYTTKTTWKRLVRDVAKTEGGEA